MMNLAKTILKTEVGIINIAMKEEVVVVKVEVKDVT